ncbi:hypothetical protein BJF90_36665 [Pseudonocardia sp. CNS-004]|nr:hypothetical protein BJF90_36665 [Pseudonocardia sp. CNS-004]
MLAVVGPSGSGKTTALRAVAGLQPVRGGRVLVAGRDVTAVPVSQRDISMVFRSTTLVPFLDVAANLARSAGAFGVPEPEAAQRVVSRSRLLGLARLLPRMPGTLSAGESGMTGIGRTLVRTPRAFLFDEPLAHLDPVERARARRTIVDAVRAAAVGALYVTHDQAEAMAVGDRLAVLHEGRIRQVDRPRRVYDAPVDTFVADFVGDGGIGLLPARLVTSDGVAGFRVGERTIPLWGPVPAALVPHVGSLLLLGFRAEDVTEAGPGATRPRWRYRCPCAASSGPAATPSSGPRSACRGRPTARAWSPASRAAHRCGRGSGPSWCWTPGAPTSSTRRRAGPCCIRNRRVRPN